ncbi:MAG: hypothetical protein FWG39_03855, partial [Alphaproteobacteria bacterium]|nr:hypothetical protein [Alphaproteobacteria bacterium]
FYPKVDKNAVVASRQKPAKIAEYKKELLLQWFSYSLTAAEQTAMVKDSLFGIVDITADCDSTNNKGFRKLALAALIKSNKITDRKLSKRMDSISYTKISLKDRTGMDIDYWLLIDARFLTGLSKNHILAGAKILFRIRQELLSCIRQQVLSYNARIGTIAI